MRTFFRRLACSNRASNMATSVSFDGCGAEYALSVASGVEVGLLLFVGGCVVVDLRGWRCVELVQRKRKFVRFCVCGLFVGSVGVCWVGWVGCVAFGEVWSGRERWSRHATRFLWQGWQDATWR